MKLETIPPARLVIFYASDLHFHFLSNNFHYSLSQSSPSHLQVTPVRKIGSSTQCCVIMSKILSRVYPAFGRVHVPYLQEVALLLWPFCWCYKDEILGCIQFMMSNVVLHRPWQATQIVKVGDIVQSKGSFIITIIIIIIILVAYYFFCFTLCVSICRWAVIIPPSHSHVSEASSVLAGNEKLDAIKGRVNRAFSFACCWILCVKKS